MTWQQPYGATPYIQYPAQQQPRRLNFVAGEDGMRSYFVGPGEVVALFDTGSPTMWLKSANEAGVPSAIAYELVEKQSDEPEAADVDGRLDAMEASIAEIKEMLTNAATVPDVRPPAAKPRHTSRGAGKTDGGRQPTSAVQ